MVVKKIGQKIIARFIRQKKTLVKSIYRSAYAARLKNKDFAIISNNCWGGDVYQIVGLPYNSPFIGLFINAPCFIKFLERPAYYLNQEMQFIQKTKYAIINAPPGYPIGVLDDMEIHFLHYSNETEAKGKWNRRKLRLPPTDKWFIKFDDRDNCTDALLPEFHALPYKHKISFTKSKYPFEDNIQLKKPTDLILLPTTYNLVDIVGWLNTGLVKSIKGILKKLHSLIPYPQKE